MSWAKIDDGLDEHPKTEDLLDGQVELAWLDEDAMQELAALACVGLWALSLANSSRRLTDGAVSPRTLRRLAPATSRVLTDRLVDVGFYDRDGDQLHIHDFLDHNPSRDEVLERRAKDAQRKAEARAASAARREANQDGPDPAAVSERTSPDVREDVRADERPDSALPDPTRPGPSTTGSVESARDAAFSKASYRGKHVPVATVRAAADLLDTFNAATERDIGAVKGDGTISAELRQLVGALVSHPDVTSEQWETAIRNTVANPPRWVQGRQMQIGDIVGDNAVRHALANTGQPQDTTSKPVSPTVARGDALIAEALQGAGR